MNWLDRTRSLLLLLVTGFFFSCESDDNSFDFELENKSSVLFEEMVLPVRSIFIDSLRTDNETSVVLGSYSDPYHGTISSNAYLKATYIDGRLPADSLTYDSLIIRLKFNEVISDLVNNETKLDIHFYDEDLISSVVYLKDKPIEVGDRVDSLTFELPGSQDTVNIAVDSLGQWIFTSMIEQTTDILFDGFTFNMALLPASGNSTALTLDVQSDSSYMTLFSHYDTIDYITTLNVSGLHHSYITNDFTGSRLEGITNGSLFDQPNNETNVKSLFGLYFYLDLAPLVEFAENNDDVIFNKVYLNSPYVGTILEPVSSLRYYFYKEKYGIKGEGVLSDSRNTIVLTNGSYYAGASELLIGTLDEESSTYEVDITFFAESYYDSLQLSNKVMTDGLVLTPSRFVSLQESQFSGSSLKVYYTVVAQ